MTSVETLSHNSRDNICGQQYHQLRILQASEVRKVRDVEFLIIIQKEEGGSIEI